MSVELILTVNCSYPQEDRYAEINRQYQEGDSPELAYQNIRKFPDWFKPYMFNYYGHGYLALYFFFIMLYGWTFKKEICKVKGRRSIVTHDHDDCLTPKQKFSREFTKERIAEDDERYTRFLKPKARNIHHH